MGWGLRDVVFVFYFSLPAWFLLNYLRLWLVYERGNGVRVILNKILNDTGNIGSASLLSAP
ncbi:hypothetical protein BO94DRAFT_530553 [Aspergillus sclerotioniger CBS 115572]|uniref:Uncharacterized protein n=1 Tax=Aspergillus sclerotioniger CBS 115572 TaxID=1450535 RepID=A0A317XBB1_9EURO|nr:hypothetical protein BO94DRAFT_530553 [Aspergillus sclerotioniger CBS 115572]PWY95823.1 hypothetical protein BO94DRAFT_530553 [Aspergillus sclerotioniger CBS 115572]